MDVPKISYQVSRGLTYSYIHIPPSSPTKPYILFLHGFPSLPIDFHHQITHLSSLGYGVIAPELLGYGDSSHPVESDSYRLKLISEDIVDILDHHAIPQVVGVGHDWGVTLLTRLEFYHSDRVIKMALLAIGCAPMGQSFDLDAVNTMMKQIVGYEGFGYMNFLTRDQEASAILNSHKDSFRSLMFCSEPATWIANFGAIGGLRGWLTQDNRAPTIEAYTDDLRKGHEAGFSDEKGGYTSTLNWYRNHVQGTNASDERNKLRAMHMESYQTQKPVLQLLSANDPISIPAVHEQMTKAYAPNAECRTLDTAHWIMLEAATLVNNELEQFLANSE